MLKTKSALVALGLRQPLGCSSAARVWKRGSRRMVIRWNALLLADSSPPGYHDRQPALLLDVAGAWRSSARWERACQRELSDGGGGRRWPVAEGADSRRRARGVASSRSRPVRQRQPYVTLAALLFHPASRPCRPAGCPGRADGVARIGSSPGAAG